MERQFTLEEARALLPDVQERAARLIELRAELVALGRALAGDAPSPAGGIPEAKALEARISEAVGWMSAHGIEVKGIAPLIVDFPSELDGEPVLLCWLENEPGLDWYHVPAEGFAGRRRLLRP